MQSKELYLALCENRFDRVKHLLSTGERYDLCLFELAQCGHYKLFIYMIKEFPDLIKYKFDNTMSIFIYCITNNDYLFTKILLDRQADKYETQEILTKAFGFDLEKNMINMLFTQSSVCRELVNNMDFLHCCASYQNNNLYYILQYTKVPIDKFIKYISQYENDIMIEPLFDKLKKLKLLPTVPDLLVSIISTEYASVYDKYYDMKEYGKERFYYALIFSTVNVVEYLYNKWNCSVNDGYGCMSLLDKIISYIDMMGQSEEDYTDKMNFLVSKGATGNIDLIKSPQLRRILTNNKEYIIQNPYQDQCPICLEDMCVGDMIFNLPCNHRFHETCFTLWNVNCPTCRWK